MLIISGILWGIAIFFAIAIFKTLIDPPYKINDDGKTQKQLDDEAFEREWKRETERGTRNNEHEPCDFY